ncbi:MAG: DUF255 domain-containing protein [Pseudomonadota bacterium]|nr:DUF255 domain-containing protein [Pseudomonadota bacterium]
MRTLSRLPPLALTLALLFGSLAADLARASDGKPSLIAWRAWDEAQFEQARREHKLILLDLEAVWCHWCHVMDQVTYNDPAVAAKVARDFLPVKVDHDARPDLAERYRDYGWPATIILDADGRDIVKRAGYIEPAAMARLLQAVVDDPSPEQDAARPAQGFSLSAQLDAATRAELERRFIASHDKRLGGLRGAMKLVDRDTVEYALLRARQGDAGAARIARQDLDAGLKLIDPAWGGVYQYSTHGDWSHPHYEKLAAQQAAYLRLYALAYRVTGEARHLKAAQAIRRYVQSFLTSPEGLIYTSQDADLKPGEKAHAYFRLKAPARRALGIPRVDRHVYARENGLMIAAYAMLYSATGDQAVLDDALAIAQGMNVGRALAEGGFRHDRRDSAGPYLSDTLAMGQGFLALFEVTGQREWLRRAKAAAEFIDSRFRAAAQPGYASAARSGRLAPGISIDENLAVARFFNLLARYGGREVDRARAEHAMKYLATPAIARARITEAGVLQLDWELANDPVHLTVVGARDDTRAQALHRAALAYPAVYRRIDWWDPREGPMDNPDVRYPDLGKPAAFVCGAGRCSLPAYSAESLVQLADALGQQDGGVERLQ